MKKEQIIELLKMVQTKKEEAINLKNYDSATQMHEKEKDLLKKLEEIEQKIDEPNIKLGL